jgi:hypothetical protein
MMLKKFECVRPDVNGVTINLRRGGKGSSPPLLHGYP